MINSSVRHKCYIFSMFVSLTGSHNSPISLYTLACARNMFRLSFTLGVLQRGFGSKHRWAYPLAFNFDGRIIPPGRLDARGIIPDTIREFGVTLKVDSINLTCFFLTITEEVNDDSLIVLVHLLN